MKKLVANAEITKAKDEANKEANETKTVEASTALVQRDECITDFKGGATAIVAQPVRAMSDTETVPSQGQPPTPEADAKEPSNPPANFKLLSMAMETRRAIIQCAEQTKLLLPAEYIKIETKEHLEEIAMAIAALKPWLQKIAKGVKGRLSGPGVAPSAADVSPATLPDQDPAEIPPTPKKRQLSLTLAEPSCGVDQTHDTIITKSARGRPVGAADNHPHKPKSAALPTVDEQSEVSETQVP